MIFQGFRNMVFRAADFPDARSFDFIVLQYQSLSEPNKNYLCYNPIANPGSYGLSVFTSSSMLLENI